MIALIITVALLAIPALAFVEELDRKRSQRLHDEEVSRQIAKQAQIDEFESNRKQFRARWQGLTAQEAVRKERES